MTQDTPAAPTVQQLIEALRQAEAGLEVAVAHKPQTTGFVPSHVLALGIVKDVLARADNQAADAGAAEPVYWEFRWKDTHPQTVTSGQWYPWEKVAPRNGHLDTVESRLSELRGYIAQGKCYELRALYAAPPTQQLQQAVARSLAPIQQAIRDYHYALDTRQHGGVAQRQAFEAICDHLGMHWKQGEEAAIRQQGTPQ